MTSEKLGQLFNMSYSAICHCVKTFKEKMNKDKKAKNQFKEINSQFKLLTLIVDVGCKLDHLAKIRGEVLRG